MFDAFLKDSSALAVGTPVNHFSLRTNKKGRTTRTMLWIMKGISALRAQIPEHFDDFRNDIPCLLDDDGIADAYIESLNLIRIVQRCPRHRRPRDKCRSEMGHRGDRSGASHLQLNIENLCCLLARGELIRSRPPGSLGRGPQIMLGTAVIHFDH